MDPNSTTASLRAQIASLKEQLERALRQRDEALEVLEVLKKMIKKVIPR